MYAIGVDIGSTSAKVAVLNEQKELVHKLVMPTGWSSTETAERIRTELAALGVDLNEAACVATGYGRLNVPYADKTVTEITCHGKGATYLFGSKPFTVIDIGGQDTKIIQMDGGMVQDFIMNDKCSAGTGRFLEIMANTLCVSLEDMCELARKGSGVSISSMCTVFAESEVISLIGAGTPKEDIAFGVIESITNKVKSQCGKQASSAATYYLTGGLCESAYILESLSEKLGSQVISSPLGRYAGAIGAGITAAGLKTR